ncbi:MAG: hypothetical protein ACRC3G_01940 [Bacteroidales bacterium]
MSFIVRIMVCVIHFCFSRAYPKWVEHCRRLEEGTNGCNNRDGDSDEG